MDPSLLARLPDAAKLGILRHLSSTTPSPAAQSSQPALPTPGGGSSANAGDAVSVPPLLAGRRMAGGLAIADGFLEPEEVQAAREEARQVLQAKARAAGMVAATPGQQWAASSVRGDEAAWLQGPDALLTGGHPRLAAAARRLAALQPWLRQQGYDVGGRPSLQLARYTGSGARYVRHRDASASVPYRSVTAILYLNPGWQAADGGALAVYSHSTTGSDPAAASAADLRLGASGAAASSAAPAAAAGEGQQQDQQQQGQQERQVASGLDEGHPATVVPPLGGRLVVMDSRLLHEVLPAAAERVALTVWFSRAPPPVPEAAPAAAPAVPPAAVPAAAPAAVPAAGEGRGAGEAPPPPQQQQPAAGAAGAAAAGRGSSAARAPPLDQSVITGPGLIFVSVPAYRDSEAQWTLADLFGKAARPERVRVGVVWQVELPGDAALMRLAGDQRQIRQVVLPATEATGPCKARALAQQLWDGEEFHLQARCACGCRCCGIDSHMRFVEGWDEALLSMLRQACAAAGHNRVVLSSYPPGYEGEGPKAVLPAAPLPTVLCAGDWGARDGLLRLRGRKLREPLAAPAPALFWAAGLSFSRAQLILEAPYRRDLPWLFFGEELLQLQRLWCAGWDVYSPSHTVAFHLWSRQHRPTFAKDRPPDEERRRASQQAVAAALAGQAGGEGSGGEGGGGGGVPSSSSGRLVRSLQAFWEHTGVDFAARTISDRARAGGLSSGAFLGADLDAYC